MFNSLLTQFHDAAPLPQITMDDAKSFIELFGSGEHYFQTFCDGDNLYQPYLVAQFYLTFEDAKERLMELNELGAGVFVTINETDGTGPRAENITAVRAVFVDLDGSPLEPVMQASGLGKSSTHYALDSLMRSEKVQHDPAKKKYSLVVKDS